MAEITQTVLQVLPALESGGVERGTLEIADELVRRGHRSLVMSEGGRLVEALEREGSQHYLCSIGKKSFWTLRHIWSLRRFLEREKVDIVHVRSRVPAWVIYLAWKGVDPNSRPRLVSTVHGLYSVSSYSAVMTKGEVVIAVSDTVKQYILDNYPDTDQGRIKVIYRGVDPSVFTENFQPSGNWLKTWDVLYPQLEGRIVLALPGRLTRLKGHHAFFEIIDRLKQMGKPVSGIVIGGEDPRRLRYAQELYDAVEAKQLNNEIIFTGHRSDIREIYSQCHAVLSLSTKPESFGRTVLEALSMRVPVIGYDHGGVGEVLGTLYPFGKIPLNSIQAAVDKVLAVIDGQIPDVKENRTYLKSRMLDGTLGVYQSLASDAVSRQG